MTLTEDKNRKAPEPMMMNTVKNNRVITTSAAAGMDWYEIENYLDLLVRAARLR